MAFFFSFYSDARLIVVFVPVSRFAFPRVAHWLESKTGRFRWPIFHTEAIIHWHYTLPCRGQTGSLAANLCQRPLWPAAGSQSQSYEASVLPKDTRQGWSGIWTANPLVFGQTAGMLCQNYHSPFVASFYRVRGVQCPLFITHRASARLWNDANTECRGRSSVSSALHFNRICSNLN